MDKPVFELRLLVAGTPEAAFEERRSRFKGDDFDIERINTCRGYRAWRSYEHRLQEWAKSYSPEAASRAAPCRPQAQPASPASSILDFRRRS